MLMEDFLEEGGEFLDNLLLQGVGESAPDVAG
jgi:hypothetical protein